MFEFITKIWYMIYILPVILITEGYELLKKFMHKRGYEIDWAYTLLAVLILILIIALLVNYGY